MAESRQYWCIYRPPPPTPTPCSPLADSHSSVQWLNGIPLLSSSYSYLLWVSQWSFGRKPRHSPTVMSSLRTINAWGLPGTSTASVSRSRMQMYMTSAEPIPGVCNPQYQLVMIYLITNMCYRYRSAFQTVSSSGCAIFRCYTFRFCLLPKTWWISSSTSFATSGAKWN